MVTLDKAALLDAPLSTGHIFGPVVEEILQKSHRVHEASQQMAALLPPRVSAWGRWSRWQASQTRTVTRTVPVPTALLGDLRHHLQACTSAANNRAQPAGRGNAGRGQPTHQRHRRRFQSQRSQQTTGPNRQAEGTQDVASPHTSITGGVFRASTLNKQPGPTGRQRERRT
ncbi:UNVERIFIED_CONTAM: hypothetical protein FKN15_049353 [Acipenser sinensis]